MKLNIQYAPWLVNQVIKKLGVFGMLGLVIMLGCGLYYFIQLLPQQQMIKPVIAPVSSQQLAQLREDFNVLATPWNELLDAIEQSDMLDIALLGIDPSVKKQQVTLTGEAKNLATILQYINKLSQQTMLSQVILQKHVVNEAVNEKPVSFSIIAKWDNARFSVLK